MNSPKFPVTVKDRESRETKVFKSHDDMEGWLEKIDIENAEYEAWDADGRPVIMSVQESTWLVLTLK